VLDLKPDKMTDEQMVLRAGELEREIYKVNLTVA
jgi:hypothetical protein